MKCSELVASLEKAEKEYRSTGFVDAACLEHTAREGALGSIRLAKSGPLADKLGESYEETRNLNPRQRAAFYIRKHMQWIKDFRKDTWEQAARATKLMDTYQGILDIVESMTDAEWSQ